MVLKSSFTSKLTRDPRQRAELYSREGRNQKAAGLFAKGGDYRQAAKLAIAAGDERLAVECPLLAVFGTASGPELPPGSQPQQAASQPRSLSPLQAAELLEAHGHYDEAIGLFELARAYRRAATTALALGQSARAARLFERGRSFYDAAVEYENAELLDDALRVLEIEAKRLNKDDRSRVDRLAPAVQETTGRGGLARVGGLRQTGKEAAAGATPRQAR